MLNVDVVQYQCYVPVSGKDAWSVKMLGGRKEEDGLWKRYNSGDFEHQ
jgi:hypothetical protein